MCLHSSLAVALVVGLASPAAGTMAAQPPAEPTLEPAREPAAEAEDLVEFAADELVYDERADTVTATGNVIVRRKTEVLTADRIVWDRRVRTVVAEGSVRIGDISGNIAVFDRAELSDDLRNGAISNMMLVLADGGRLAASGGTRRDGVSELDRAIYSPCAVVDETGCPQTPLWAVKAVRVRHDPEAGRVFYRKARLEAWGVPVLALPGFSHPDSALRNQSGLLSPNAQLSRDLGFELEIPYYWAIGPQNDLTATAHLYSEANPLLGLEYRHLLPAGPIRFHLRGTWSEGVAFDDDLNIVSTSKSAFRGMLEGNGRLSHGDGWRSTFSARLTNDPNFPGRYQVTLDTRLRTTYALERETDTLWFGIRSWYFQDLSADADPATVPIVIPLFDVAYRPDVTALGGRVGLEANGLSLFRQDGQDSNRILGQVRWDRGLLLSGGQRIRLTGLVRTDFYQVSDSRYADAPEYAGRDGVSGRVIPLAAVDIDWPLAGRLGRGTQVIRPRVQFVASGTGDNEAFPNEDSRAIELEDINLFAFNRFPGFDRWEGGARITYGATWNWSRPGLALAADVGQSYRAEEQPGLYPEGTGLEDRLSDIVGRFSIRTGRLGNLTQRFRLDKDSLAVRRSELDFTFGNERTYASVGYLRFNRNSSFEDIQDHEEVRAGAQIAVFRYWSLFGSTVIDLTSAEEDPTTINDGFQPIRTRVGFIYADECFDFRFTWRRNYVDNVNAREGSSFSFSFRLKNLGVTAR